MARKSKALGSDPDEINLWALAYQHRRALGPVYVAAASATSAALSVATLSSTQTGVTLTSACVAGAVLIGTSVKTGLRKVYAAAVLAASTSWTMIAHEMWDYDQPWIWSSLTSATLVLGVPWWASRRQKEFAKVDAAMQDWPNAARRIGLDRSRMRNVSATPIGRRGTIEWTGGDYKTSTVLRMKEEIEGALHAKEGTLELEKDPNGSTNRVHWQVIERDPHHAKAQKWSLPDQELSILDPLVLGPKRDGQLIAIDRFAMGSGARHALAAGMNGSGKSSFINLDVASTVCSYDAVTIGFDFKKVELSPWKPALDLLVTSVEEAREFVHAVVAEGGLLKERQDILAESGARCWNPAVHGPVISLIVDEAKELLGGSAGNKVVDEFSSIGNLARALGLRFSLSTQYPTVDAIGSTQIREQIRHSLCFRMKSDQGERFVIPNGNVRADLISAERPGTAYVQNGDKVEGPIRVYYLDDDMVTDIVKVRQGRTAQMDERSEAAITRLFPEYADRERFAPLDEVVDESRETVTVTGATATGATPRLRDSGTATSATGDESHSTATELGGETATSATEADESRATGPESRSGAVEVAPGIVEVAAWEEGEDVDLDEIFASRRARETPEERIARERTDAEEARVKSKRPTTAQAEAAVIEILDKAGAKGSAPRDIQAACGRGSSWFYSHMDRLKAAGVARNTTYGTYALVKYVGPAPAPLTDEAVR